MHDLNWLEGTIRVIEDGEFRVIMLVDYNGTNKPVVIAVEKV